MDCHELVMKSFPKLQAPRSLLKLVRVPRSARGLFLFLALVCVLGMPSEAMAEDPIQSAAEIDYPPFSIVDANGQADGFSVDLLRAALKAMNREVVFRTGPWKEVRGWLERGEIQALPLVGRTPEREHLFDFTFSYMTLHGAIVVREDNKEIHDIGDLRGRQVAVMKGDNAEEFLRREERGIQIHTTTTFKEALRELSQGQYDAVVIQRLMALRLIQEMGLTNLRVLDRPIEGFRQDFCFAVKEGDRDTLALLNEGLSIVMADGTYRHLHAKWFAALQLPTDRPIVIAGDHNYPPFEYLDEKGRPAGFTVELTRAIARQMNMDVRIRLGPWAKVLEGLKSGNIDAIQGIFYSPERDRTLDFSPPYLVSHYVSVVREGSGPPPETLEDLAGKSLVVEAGDVIQDLLVKQGVGGRVSAVETQEEVLRTVSEGQYDCGLALRLSALYLIKKNGWTNLLLGSRSFFAGKYCYAVPMGQSALLAQFSEGLKVVEDSGEFHRIYEEWLGGYEESPPSLVNALRYSALVLIPLLLILLAIFLWSWSLRRQVAAKTLELQESVDRFKYIFESANVGKSITLPTGEVDANKAFADFLGYTQDQLKGKRWQELTVDEDIEGTERVIASLIAGQANSVRFEKRYIHKNGDILWADVSTALRRNSDGTPLYFVTTIVDITERKRTEGELRRSEGRLRFLTENMADIIWTSNLDLRITYASLSIEKILGFKREERTNQSIKQMVTPESRKMIEDLLSVEYQREKTEVMDPERSMTIEVEYFHKNGGTVWLENTVKWIRDPDGSIVEILGVARDISDRKRAEAEREKLQAQLIQAQKMESVGRLAGGVAHDFNNKLTVILGYAQMAMEGLDKTDPIYANLQQILQAGRHSVDIVRQLLAFARKQIISPEVLDLNETLEGMLKMLRRLIGEDIDLAWEPDTNLWPVKMDPTQIDQILANLCVNSRDAISGVGKVTIETENVVLDKSYCADHAGFLPGEYVMLAVSDNGCGMDKETLANAFEPFFTTKEVGKGTGLGLSTVYGIAKQNQGFVNVYSEPGKGTTFKIYLPRHLGEAEEGIEAAETEMPQARGETILVVEDETSVLHLARRILEKLGYAVLTSASPAEAVAMASEHDSEIHLLITDVVLPGMSGRDLAGEILQIRPTIKSLFMSGYTADVIARQGVLDKGVQFIEKPFTPDSLARKVREAMDQ
ncbi:MAG: hypothetical protein QG552_2310 [Thermodesulfobacteriota bacterium]|nr:hypothetical protein [Thermodesulfobacteriota bacterium]